MTERHSALDCGSAGGGYNDYNDRSMSKRLWNRRPRSDLRLVLEDLLDGSRGVGLGALEGWKNDMLEGKMHGKDNEDLRAPRARSQMSWAATPKARDTPKRTV